MVHSARPLRTSRSSLAKSGVSGALLTVTVSGERKEHVLQSRRVVAARRAQLVERAHAAHAAVRQQHEAVADPLGVDELDRKSTRLNSSHSQISYAVFCL